MPHIMARNGLAMSKPGKDFLDAISEVVDRKPLNKALTPATVSGIQTDAILVTITGSSTPTRIATRTPNAYSVGDLVIVIWNNRLRTWGLQGGSSSPSASASSSRQARNYYNAGTYSTGSSSLVDVDVTNMNFTLETTGNDIRITFKGVISASGGDRIIEMTVLVDGVTSYELFRAHEGSEMLCNTVLILPMASGTHTFKLQWSTSGGTATIDNGSMFDVREEDLASS